MATEKNRPVSEEFGQEEQPGFFARLHRWLMDDSPSWLISAVFHSVLLLAIGLLMGGKIIKMETGGATVIETARVEPVDDKDTLIERMESFDLTDPSLETAVLNTKILTTIEPEGQVAQDVAKYYTDDPEFTEVGGGTASGRENAAGGFGLSSLKAAGLGPLLRGPGGAEVGKGDGNGPGTGGPESGFGSRVRKGHTLPMGVTKTGERVVAKALFWLARHQSPDGSWSLDKFQAQCKDDTCTIASNGKYDAAGTAMGLLPFLAAGQTHVSKGPYQTHVARGVKWLIDHQKPDGDLSAGASQMYSHGLATIALCEAYGMSGDYALREPAQKAIRFIETGQNQEGSWRYTHGSADSDTSVYGWQMMALKSGIMAHLAVDQNKLNAGRKWLALASAGKGDSSSGSGKFGYTAKGGATPCMSAVGLLISQYLGVTRDDPAMIDGAAYLMRNLPDPDKPNLYYWYYATQVMHNLCDADWDTWNRGMRRMLVETQCKSGCAAGSWEPQAADRHTVSGGRIMATSLSALTLEVYYRYLPLYQRESDKKDWNGAKEK